VTVSSRKPQISPGCSSDCVVLYRAINYSY